jgi:hypothetical protein
MTTAAANPETLKKKIADLKGQLTSSKAKPKHDPTVRQARKALKRAQRRLAILVPETPEAKLKRLQRNLDLVGKEMGELTKGSKKVVGNPYVHSMRKKTKSLNKRVKRVNWVLEAKKAASGGEAAPAAPSA